MIRKYESPIIEIIEFSDYIATFSNDDDIIPKEQVNGSSGGWLPWI